MALQTDFLKYIQSAGSGNGSNKTAEKIVGGAVPFLNCVFDPNATQDTKAKSIVDFAIGTLLALGCGEETKASKEVSSNEKDAANLEDSVKTTTETTNRKVEEILEKIDQKIAAIQENIKKIDEQNQKREEYQAKIDEQKAIIEENKKVLNDSSATKKERTEALNNIKNAGKAIDDLTIEIESLMATIEEVTQVVEQSQEETQEQGQEIEDVIEDATAQTQSDIQEAASQQTTNVASSAEGATNNVQGAAAEAEAITLETTSTASSWIPIVGAFTGAAGQATAAKLQQTATDQFGAGATRITGAARNISTIMNTYNLAANNLFNFQNYTSYAVGMISDADDVSQSFYSVCEPLGAWCSQAAELEGEGETITQAADEAQKELEAQDEDAQNDGTGSAELFNYDTEKLKIEV